MTMATGKVKLNFAGFLAVRQSSGAQEAITREANRIAATANASAVIRNSRYTAKPAMPTVKGSVATVTTAGSGAAATDQALHNTLLKAVSG